MDIELFYASPDNIDEVADMAVLLKDAATVMVATYGVECDSGSYALGRPGYRVTLQGDGGLEAAVEHFVRARVPDAVLRSADFMNPLFRRMNYDLENAGMSGFIPVPRS